MQISTTKSSLNHSIPFQITIRLDNEEEYDNLLSIINEEIGSIKTTPSRVKIAATIFNILEEAKIENNYTIKDI